MKGVKQTHSQVMQFYFIDIERMYESAPERICQLSKKE